MHLFADVHCTEGIISCPPEGEEDRGDDETKLKISGRQVFVWTAIDADTRSFRLSMHHTERRTPTPSHLSRGSSIRALGRLSCCGRRFMVPAASQSQATMTPRDVRVRERHGEALQEMKERTGRFYNNLSEGLNLQSFIDLFMLWYHHLREASGT